MRKEASATGSRIDNPLRPTRYGVCRYCHCTDGRACPERCAWFDCTHTVCTATTCLQKFLRDWSRLRANQHEHRPNAQYARAACNA